MIIWATPARAQQLNVMLHLGFAVGGRNRPLAALEYMASRRVPTILLVEDHEPTRTFLADNLTADGFEILDTDTLAGARRLLERQAPDLMLLDLGLPDGDGLELIRTIRESDSHGRLDADLPTIVLSGRGGRAPAAARLSARLRRLRAEALQYPRAVRAGRRAAAPQPRPPPRRADPRWAAGDRRDRARGLGRRVAGGAERQGVRPAAGAGRRADARVHPRRAAARRVGLPGRRRRPARSTRMPPACGASSGRHGAELVVNVWGVGYRLLDPEAPA